MLSNEQRLLTKITTSDIIKVLEYFGVSEEDIRYGNDSLILPTICHNELCNRPSHKLYYYETSKRFYCYTHCKSMSIIDFIINSHKAKGLKFSFSQAYSLLDRLIDDRQKHGFAIITMPKMKPVQKIVKNWEEAMTVYNYHVLECFTQQPRFLEPWSSEGIDYNVLTEFGVRFDMVRNRIVFPIYDHIGRLVGIKVRNFNQKDIDEGRKYMPLWHNKELYTYPKMMVAYGFYQNRHSIKRAKEVIVYEAEKSVLKHGSLFTQNKSIAVGGGVFSIYHAHILKMSGVTNIVIAFDNDWDEDGDKKYGLKKAISEGKKIKEMGFNVEIMYDYDEELLDNKDAPIDKGRAVYSKMYRDRKNIENLLDNEIETKEEENNEIQINEQEL